MAIISAMFLFAGPLSHFCDNPLIVPMSTAAVITRVSLVSPEPCLRPESRPHFQLHAGCYWQVSGMPGSLGMALGAVLVQIQDAL